MVLLEKLKDEIEVVPTNIENIQPFVLKHYLGKDPHGIKKVYGIRYKPTGDMIGMVIYGVPMKSATQVVSTEVPSNEVWELKRFFIKDEPSIPNIESFVIAKTLGMIKQEFPDIKVVITFADEKVGHMGSIYQATNAIYLGKSGGKHKYAYILRGNLKAINQLLQNKPYPKKEN